MLFKIIALVWTLINTAPEPSACEPRDSSGLSNPALEGTGVGHPGLCEVLEQAEAPETK